MKRNSIKVEFFNPNGQTLAARLEKPEGEARAYAIFAHCFTCSKDVAAASRISRELSRLGVAVLRFDFTGLGNSEGEFEETNFSSNVEDLVAAADFLRTKYQAPSLLVGHSLGGAAVLVAAAKISEVKALVTIAAPSDPAHLKHLLKDRLEDVEKKGKAMVQIGPQAFPIHAQFLKDLQQHDVKSQLSSFRGATLILHSEKDDIVDIDHARRIFEMARHPKSFISLDGADHLLSRRDDSIYAASMISAWASRYL